MKKLFLLAAMAVISLSASAQLVQSTMLQRNKTKTRATWYVRAGISLNKMTGEYTDVFKEDAEHDGYKFSNGSKVGYDLAFGFQKNFGKSDLYWGMELGLGTRGLKNHFDEYEYGDWTETLLAHSVKYSPFTLGYKFGITDNLKIDAHLGIFASFDIAGNWTDGDTDIPMSEWYHTRGDAGLQAGVGVWFNRFNLDLTYQKGFIDAELFSDGDYNCSAKSSNFMIRLGYAF